MTPTLLAYQIDPGKLGRMQVVCLRLGIRVQAVDPADFGQPIGALAGVLPRAADAPAAPLRRQGHAAPARERRPPMSYLFLYLAAINVIAFAAMGIDKAKARAGKWRIAEGTLFALAALGGALGGTLGMRVFHHKTKHKEFRFGFPALLCLQCAAVVYLILIWKQVL